MLKIKKNKMLGGKMKIVQFKMTKRRNEKMKNGKWWMDNGLGYTAEMLSI